MDIGQLIVDRVKPVLLTRLSLFDPDSGNFGAQWPRQVLEKPAVEPAKSAEIACGADLPPCGTTGGFESLPPPCFCATKRVARTARSTAPGASSRTAGWLAGVRCSGTCSIWAR